MADRLLIVGEYHAAHREAEARGLTPNQWHHIDGPAELRRVAPPPGTRCVWLGGPSSTAALAREIADTGAVYEDPRTSTIRRGGPSG